MFNQLLRLLKKSRFIIDLITSVLEAAAWGADADWLSSVNVEVTC
jgi:hypothetical protein